MSRDRRTKIVATVGPASSSPDRIAAMTAAGMDVARIPLAHTSLDDALALFARIRDVSPGVGVMADLPGPKVRSLPFVDGGVHLDDGAEILVTAHADGGGLSDRARVVVPHDGVVELLRRGDQVALGDGGIVLRVDGRRGDDVVATIVSGGWARGRVGVTVPSHRLTASTPTADDLARLGPLAEAGIDFVAVSFVRSADDVVAVRRAAGSPSPMVIAKIETAEAVEDLDSIVAVADAVMVARGDLGVRLPLEDVPHVQKRVIRAAVRFGRPVITATQMLESMVSAPVPTRAEVTDVANAILDGTSALMLSGETAIGERPVEVVRTMATIASRAEDHFDHLGWGRRLAPQEVAGGRGPARITATTTAAGWRAAVEEQAACIVACTRSGATARAISRFRPPMPLLACTPSDRTALQLTLSWGVRAVTVGEAATTDEAVDFGIRAALETGSAHPGDVVVVLAGSPMEAEPVTDTMRLVRIR